mgnify:CR=1 FL=1|tara:strand:+ start:1378 stop:2082 length:705 start_codon:yes stop_codon:yes gene_type:complete
MGRKVFVSYKYKDTQVLSMDKKNIGYVGGKFSFIPRSTRVRDYVDKLQEIIGKDNINLGEKDGESLNDFSDSTIQSSLKDKIFNSSVTIVMISKGMKEANKAENEQWIPWEISYSLKEITRADRTSRMNAILGVVLPDELGSYEWYYRNNPDCNSITHFTNQLFKMLQSNMFNLKIKETKECNGTTINISNEPSFIKTVKWEEFINKKDYNFYIEKAISIRDNKDLYELKIKLG